MTGADVRATVNVHREGDMVHWYASGDRGALGWGRSYVSGAICGVMHWYDWPEVGRCCA